VKTWLEQAKTVAKAKTLLPSENVALKGEKMFLPSETVTRKGENVLTEPKRLTFKPITGLPSEDVPRKGETRLPSENVARKGEIASSVRKRRSQRRIRYYQVKPSENVARKGYNAFTKRKRRSQWRKNISAERNRHSRGQSGKCAYRAKTSHF